MKLKVLIVVGAIALGQMGQIQAADANPPELMTYQGYLVDGNGYSLGSEEDPSDSTQRVSSPANYIVRFSCFTRPKQGGTAIWAEQQTVTVEQWLLQCVAGAGISVRQ